MTVALPNRQGASIEALVIKKQLLTPDIVHLVLEYETQFSPLSFNLKRPDGLARSYSIANIQLPKNTPEFHIRRLPHGQFSSWVYDELEIGAQLAISEAQGSCHYLPQREEQPLMPTLWRKSIRDLSTFFIFHRLLKRLAVKTEIDSLPACWRLTDNRPPQMQSISSSLFVAR
ncbi:FAD-binding oxidoreductase [Methylobacter sp.]|uniref:FAD-binding oxidoreductase n=1 Tax=Methylobacter sp. TaxID=2051955 RepID=UPI002FDF03D6